MEKKPFVTLEQVKEMAASYPTPFHLYDEKGIRENARKLKAAFAWNPNFHEYFAVKAKSVHHGYLKVRGNRCRLFLLYRAFDVRCCWS